MNYKALVKLRKQQFDRAERELAAANARLQKLVRRKEALREELKHLQAPESGSGGSLRQLLMQRRTLQGVIASLEPQIEAALFERADKEQALKTAHIRWEQAKSLEADALKKVLEKMRRQERSRLDEIASGQYWRDRHYGKGRV